MFRIIHPNRWFIWTLVSFLAGALIMMFWIESYLLETERDANLISSQVSGWKTYSSENFGLSIRYPATWQIETDPQEIHQVSFQNPNDYNENVTIYMVDPKYEKDIRSSLRIASEVDVIIDGFLGEWITGADKSDLATSNVVLVKRGGTLYYIAGSARVFERMIKSIKFLPPLNLPLTKGEIERV